ncbi:MAG: hypothetical protein WA510_21125, partial [Acidobacteriaceae bacterium]
IFGFAFRDAAVCLFRSRDDGQLRAVEWYFAIVMLTFIWNLDESFLFEPKHLGSMIFLIACIGLKGEWMNLREARSAGNQERGRAWVSGARQSTIPASSPSIVRLWGRVVP